MASRKTLFELFQTVPDEQLEEFLANTRDLDIRLAALRELTRDDAEVSNYETEISETIDAFFLLLAAHLGSTRNNKIKPFLSRLFRTKFATKSAKSTKPLTTKPQTPRTWKWPTTEAFPAENQKSWDGDFKPVSALGLFGYTVGKTNGWREDLRQEFLMDFIELELPQIVEENDGDKYGDPLTSKRLEAVANLLASHIRNAKRRDSHSMRFAISDWEDDLAFLKEQYYVRAGLRFSWPNTSAPR